MKNKLKFGRCIGDILFPEGMGKLDSTVEKKIQRTFGVNYHLTPLDEDGDDYMAFNKVISDEEQLTKVVFYIWQETHEKNSKYAQFYNKKSGLFEIPFREVQRLLESHEISEYKVKRGRGRNHPNNWINMIKICSFLGDFRKLDSAAVDKMIQTFGVATGINILEVENEDRYLAYEFFKVEMNDEERITDLEQLKNQFDFIIKSFMQSHESPQFSQFINNETGFYEIPIRQGEDIA